MTGVAPSLLERLAHPHADAAGSPARSWLESHGLPSGREEAWRYTPVSEIVSKLDGLVRPTPQTLELEAIDLLAGDHGGPRLVLVNGELAGELSRLGTALPGVSFGTSGGHSANDARELAAGERYDGFQALNHVGQANQAVITVAAGSKISEPLHVIHVSAPGSAAAISQTRTLVRLGEGSEATLIETYVGLGGGCLTNASTIVELAEGATLNHHRVQDEPLDTIHVGHTRVEQAGASQLRSLSVTLGASIARHALDITLHAPGAEAWLDGAYLPSGAQRHDNVVTVDHAAPGCRSVQRFKGVIGDDARGSFGGHVIVRPGADGTDARQSNRNLLLTKTAQADTRPWLEIFADDVRCTHGATVGRLDEEALFYLRSRGIPLQQAKAMLVAAFVAELTEPVTPGSLRERLEAAIATRIGGTR